MSARRLSRHSLPAAGRGAAVCRSLDSGLTTYGDPPTPGDGPAPIEAVRDGPCLAPGTPVVTRVFLAIIVGYCPPSHRRRRRAPSRSPRNRLRRPRTWPPPAALERSASPALSAGGSSSSRAASFRISTASTAAAGSRSAGGIATSWATARTWSLAGLYSAKGYKLVEADRDVARSSLRSPRPWRYSVLEGCHTGGVSRAGDGPAPPTSTPPSGCSRQSSAGTRPLRLHRWVRLTDGDGVRGLHAGGSDRPV